jgi:ABC-type transport system substrate-binding protein
LRNGATFSDGNSVTAKDVVETYARVVQSHSPLASLFAGVAHVSGSENTVEISLLAPLSVLPDVLANPALGIVEAAALPTGPMPVGSGPFTVTARSSGNFTLTRSGPGRALLDGLSLVTFPNDASSYEAFRAGRVDWSAVPPVEAAGAATLTREQVSRPLDAELFYGFNLRDPVVANVQFRQAVVHAVDRAAVAAGPYRGTATAATGLALGSDACGDQCTFDPAGARTTLASVFGPTGPPSLNVDFDSGTTEDAVVAAIADDLRAVGVFANVRAQPAATYSPNVAGSGDELFREGWVAQYPGPDGVLAPLFMTGAPDNVTGFSSADVDAAIRAARAEPDPTRRAADYRSAEQKILEQAPVLPLVEFQSHSVAAPNVGGLVVNGMGTWDPATVWLAAAR